MKDDEIFEMKVEGLTLDPLNHVPIILLKDVAGKKVLPIWVGVFEANAIALEMEQVATPRPMTHDLIKNLLDEIGAQVQDVTINDLRENTFFAVISFVLNNSLITLDARPSDAIAIALRLKVPIFAAKKVVEAARSVDLPESKDDLENRAKWKQWIDDVKPTDFGN